MNFKDRIFKNQSPWGTGSDNNNGSGNTNQPPNLDEIIANIQKKLINFFLVENQEAASPLFWD